MYYNTHINILVYMLTIISKYDIICNCITVLQHMRWPISGANRKDLRLVLDISAVLHGSFPPSDGHLQLWSMGDNIVDPFGALMADQMSPKLLVDCHSFPTLDENCSYSNPPKNRTALVNMTLRCCRVCASLAAATNCSRHDPTPDFSSLLKLFNFPCNARLFRLVVCLVLQMQALQERSHVCIQREECNC